MMVQYLYKQIWIITTEFLWLSIQIRGDLIDIKRITIRLNDDLHTALKHIAIEDKTSLQDMFVKAIEEKYTNRILEKTMRGEK